MFALSARVPARVAVCQGGVPLLGGIVLWSAGSLSLDLVAALVASSGLCIFFWVCSVVNDHITFSESCTTLHFILLNTSLSLLAVLCQTLKAVSIQKSFVPQIHTTCYHRGYQRGTSKDSQYRLDPAVWITWLVEVAVLKCEHCLKSPTDWSIEP